MADKQTNELATIPLLAANDLFNVFDITEGGSEKIKKIDAVDVITYIPTKLPANYIRKVTIQSTPASYGVISRLDGKVVVETSVVTSQEGGIFRIDAGSEFEGVGTGEMQLFLNVNAAQVRMGNVVLWGNQSYGNSTQFGADTLVYMINTTQSNIYTIQVLAQVTNASIGWTANPFNRFIYTTEYVY